MTLVQRIFTHAQNNGFQGVENDITEVLKDALNLDVIEGVKSIFTYIQANVYNLDFDTFENKYFIKWIGTGPRDR